MTPEQQARMIQETHDKVTQIHAAIFGVEGKGGCLEKCNRTAKDFYNLRLALALILGTGLVTVGGIDLARKLIGG